MVRVFGMTKCQRCGAKIIELEYDYDLSYFHVLNEKGRYIGSIYPYNLDELRECQKALKEGECPICDKWEDGHGQTLGL